MNDQKRFITAIILIMAILGLYSLLKPPATKPFKTNTQETQVEGMAAKAIAPKTARKTARDIKINDTAMEVETAFLKAELSTAAAGIKKLWTKKNGGASFSEKPLLLAGTNSLKTLELVLEGAGEDVGEFKIVEDSENEIALLKKTSEDIEVEKRFIFSKSNYNIELYITISNKSQSGKVVSYDLAAATNLQFSSVLDKRFLNVGSYDGKNLIWAKPKEAIKAAKRGEVYDFAKNPKWAVLRNTHSSTIITPHQDTGYVYLLWSKGDSGNQDDWSLGVSVDAVIIPPESEIVHEYTLYAGPTMEENLVPLGLGEAVNYGKLNVVCILLVKVLTYFYGVTGSYGIAIILLVIAINIFTYPLTYKNVKSMRNMQAVQPHMAKLKEAHKGDQKKLQAETMKLYRERNVNPMGGCLPMLLQMPIFISLYVTLARSPMLKGSNFLWIKDLSLPDALFSFKAIFGRALPLLGESFNLLPILMMIAMVVQQKISMSARSGSGERSPQEQQQQKMMIMMPIIFGFIFYSLPSGLVLYWTVNTALMALAHFLIQKQLEKTTLADA